MQLLTHAGKTATPARSIELLEKARRMSPWERIGTSFAPEDNISVTDAFQQAGLLWEASKEPLYRKNRQGEYVVSTHGHSLVNMATDKELDIVGPRYEIIQNAKLAEYLEPAKSLGPVINAGNTGYQGKTTFVLFQGQEFDVRIRNVQLADPLRMFTAFRETKELGLGVEITRYAIRVQCINGVLYVDAQKILGATIKHVAGANALAKYVGEAIGVMGKLDQGFKGDLQRFANTLLRDESDALAMFREAFPAPVEGRDLQRLRELEQFGALDGDGRAILSKKEEDFVNAVAASKGYRDACAAAYHGECATQKIAGTAYGALQAVLAVCDHRIGRSQKEVAHASLFGSFVAPKVRAWRFAANFSQN